jgi:type IV pilus assembly protein PilC
MQFDYLARDASGTMRSGIVAADSSAEAARKLRQDGLFTLSINEARAPSRVSASLLFARRVTRGDICYLTSQLAVMVDAGIPVAQALGGLAKQSENPTLKAVLERVQEDVEGGGDFSAALAKFPRYFDDVFVNLVKAGEVSGLLGALLERIATQMRSDLEQRQKLRGALMYPGVMLTMCLGACIFLLTFVLPKIAPMFVARGIELPTPTVIMMTASYLLTHYWWAFLLGGIGLATFWWYSRKKWWFRLGYDWVILRVPVLGPLVTKSILARTTRTFAAMLNAGVPVLDAIALCAAVSENIYYERAWKDLAEKVTAGRQIHDVLESNTLFPKTLVQMIGSGEQTGKLGMVLGRVGNYYDSEVSIAIKSVTSLLEPIMVAGMGVVVGGLALAMLLPIFKLSSHVG